MASRTLLSSLPHQSLLSGGGCIKDSLPPRSAFANALSFGPCSSKPPSSESYASKFLRCKDRKGFAKNSQAALNLSRLRPLRNSLDGRFTGFCPELSSRSSGRNGFSAHQSSASHREGIRNTPQKQSLLCKARGKYVLASAGAISTKAIQSEGFAPVREITLKSAAVNRQSTSSDTEPPSEKPTNLDLVHPPENKKLQKGLQETSLQEKSSTASEKAEASGPVLPSATETSQENPQERPLTASEKAQASGLVILSEPELVDFVREFLDGSVGRRSVLPKVVVAARSAGVYLGKGELPAVLQKYPETFEYNPATQYLRLRRPGKPTDKGPNAEPSFAVLEDRFIDFVLALLQERVMPPDGLFFCWVAELANHSMSGVNLTGLPRPTRMVSRHLDLFDIDGYGTSMVRVKLTEQGRLRTPKPLPREFRLYLRSDAARQYRDGVWIREVDRKTELEERAKALTEEELAVVLFLVRTVHAEGPGATHKFLHLGQMVREAGLTVRGKSPKLVNIAMKSREVFDVHDLGTAHVAVSLTQEGWDAAEKLPPTEVPSAECLK